MRSVNRRTFLGQTAAASGYLAGRRIIPAGTPRVALVADRADPIASSTAAQWAAGELSHALAARGVSVIGPREKPEVARGADYTVAIAGGGNRMARDWAGAVQLPNAPESLALAPSGDREPGTLAWGADARGLVYALLELADRVRYGDGLPVDALRVDRAVVETPANKVRCITRAFQSDVEDKPWYNDRSFWPPYLTMLAAQRFNRVGLCFGLGYDFTRDITDCYFHFAYPFLVAVPGYDVRAVPLPDAERDRNLAMMRFISDEVAARGLEFHLGLWTHAYEWHDSPHANYTIRGLTPQTHAAYCRDALRMTLRECPAINGVVLRTHGESGVPEGSYDFWKTVFDGAATCGRQVEINLHAKGLDQRMIGVALATGLPVSVAPKFCAEHMGLPYQQADIRELEKARPGKQRGGFFALSAGSRSFMRYSYGDLLTEGRRYQVYTRTWPGTQRHLLWADPVSAAAYSRASQFDGETGLDLFEPLSFKGRRGSGKPGGRCAYADRSLSPEYDWQKFLYSYRVWGRRLYNPGGDAEEWRRFLRAKFGGGALAIETALANASRILPLVTSAHGASAANNHYWPEMYTNMSMISAGAHPLYDDSPAPQVFGNVSPFDPELFCGVNEFAKEILEGNFSGKISPVQVASWLEDMAAAAEARLIEAERAAGDRWGAEFRRVAVDASIQIHLGRFFARKFRAAVLYGVFRESNDPSALGEAIRLYSEARDAWADAANDAGDAYSDDITYGPEAHLRGHWRDRLAAIEQDIAAMQAEEQPGAFDTRKHSPEQVGRAILATLSTPEPRPLKWQHQPATQFTRGKELPVQVQVGSAAGMNAAAVRLRFRHVNQAEDYQVAEMSADKAGAYRTTIPATYTDSPFALQYFFQVQAAEWATLLPGLDPNAPSQPYYCVMQD